MRPIVHVVTDSTASLPPGQDAVQVVPLHVALDTERWAESDDQAVADHLRAGGRVTTSQPPPAAFEAAYDKAAAAGATGILSVHLSGELSGTVHAAALAASRAPIPVEVIDSRTAAMALGFAALAAAETAAHGGALDAAARRALAVADSARAAFMVDSLDHLRRGGRLNAASAALGTVLGVRPLLAVRGGRIEVVEKVRTRRTAVDRLVGVALASADRRREPRFAVHYLGDDEVALQTAERLAERATVEISPVSAVLGAHVGPGVLAVVVVDWAAGRAEPAP